MVRVTGFACISFSLAGDAKKKERNSPVFALAHAHAAGMCGHDSNPVTEKGKHPPCGGVSLFGPSDRIRTCGIVVPNHARYQLRYTRMSSEETRSVPFPPGGENCTCAPSSFISKPDPLRWAPIWQTGEKKLAPFHSRIGRDRKARSSKPFYYTSQLKGKQEIFPEEGKFERSLPVFIIDVSFQLCYSDMRSVIFP